MISTSSKPTSKSRYQEVAKATGSRFGALALEGEEPEEDVESDAPAPEFNEVRPHRQSSGKRRKPKNKKRKKNGAVSKHANDEHVTADAEEVAEEPVAHNQDEEAIDVIDITELEDDEVPKLQPVLLRPEFLVLVVWMILAYPIKWYIRA